MIEILVKNIVITFFGILVSCLVTLIGFSFGNLIYYFLLGEVHFFIPFYIFFNIYNLLKNQLINKEAKLKKIPYQLILSFGCLLIIVMAISIIVKIGLDMMWEDVYHFIDNYALIVIFVPIAIIIDFFYEPYYNKMITRINNK